MGTIKIGDESKCIYTQYVQKAENLVYKQQFQALKSTPSWTHCISELEYQDTLFVHGRWILPLPVIYNGNAEVVICRSNISNTSVEYF